MNKHRLLLAILIISALGLRLFLAFTTPNFTYDSYFHLRQVEHIAQFATPLFDDPLSYGGREMIFLPFFHYVMGFFALLLPLEISAKILPNLLSVLLIPLTYRIAHTITQNKTASLFSALIAAALPVLYQTNEFTPFSLFLPLVFLTIYAFIRHRQKRFLFLYIFSFLALSLTSTATLLLLVGFGIYLLLSFVEAKRVRRGEIELILFSLFFFIWSQILFLKSAFLEEGMRFFWLNVPSALISQYFPQLSIPNAIVLVSIIPLLCGIYIVYHSLFKTKNKTLFLLISLTISTSLLAWLRIIRFEISLAFFGIILALLFAPFYQELIAFLKRTRFPKLAKFAPLTVTILLLLSMLIPAGSYAFAQQTPSNSEIGAFQWIKQNTPKNTGVAALLEEGHLITYISERQNLMDTQFGQVEDVDTRFTALDDLYTTNFQVQAISIMEEYQIDYIMITPTASERFNSTHPPYVPSPCFTQVYENNSRIYRLTCTLTEG